jgi:hypothetical protein
MKKRYLWVYIVTRVELKSEYAVWTVPDAQTQVQLLPEVIISRFDVGRHGYSNVLRNTV